MSEESRKIKFMHYVTVKNLLTNGKGMWYILLVCCNQRCAMDFGFGPQPVFEFGLPWCRYLVPSCICRGRKIHRIWSKFSLWPQSIRLLLQRIIKIRNYHFQYLTSQSWVKTDESNWQKFNKHNMVFSVRISWNWCPYNGITVLVQCRISGSVGEELWPLW